MRAAAAGVGLTVLIAGVVWLLSDRVAATAAGLAGLLAAAIHVTAVSLLKPALVRPFERLWTRWAVGLGVRVAGLAAVATAMLAAPGRFPTLATAVGFIGVLLPLLFSEMRLVMRAMRVGP